MVFARLSCLRLYGSVEIYGASRYERKPRVIKVLLDTLSFPNSLDRTRPSMGFPTDEKKKKKEKEKKR